MKSSALLLLLFPLLACAEDVTLLDGTILKNVEKTSSDPLSVTYTHDDGVSRVNFSQMSEEVRKSLGYDEEKAVQFSEQKKAALAAQQQAKIAALEEEMYLKRVEAREKKEAADYQRRQDGAAYEARRIRAKAALDERYAERKELWAKQNEANREVSRISEMEGQTRNPQVKAALAAQKLIAQRKRSDATRAISDHRQSR